MMTIKQAAAVATLMALGGAAAAVEVPAVFDAKNCHADYPKSALVNEEQGTVSANFLVGADGRVVESKLERSSGSRVLDRAALTAITACKFKPGTKDGKPDQTWTKVEYTWKL